MVLGEEERKIYSSISKKSRCSGGESSQHSGNATSGSNLQWCIPKLIYFPPTQLQHPERNERCSSPSQGWLPELTKTDEPQIRINNWAVNKARWTREGMGTEKGKFQAGLMMERELHWSRSHHTAQLLVPSGGKGFGRSDVSQGIQVPVKTHWHIQSASVSV